MGNLSGVLATQDSSDVPIMKSGAVASSGNVANANAVSTLAAKVGQVGYLTGFQLTAGAATAAAAVTATVTGLAGGTMSISFGFPSTASGIGGASLSASFYPALQASAANTAIVVTLPAGGSGNTIAATSLQGFYADAGV